MFKKLNMNEHKDCIPIYYLKDILDDKFPAYTYKKICK